MLYQLSYASFGKDGSERGWHSRPTTSIPYGFVRPPVRISMPLSADRRLVLRLVQPQFAAAGQSDVSQRSPSFFMHFGTADSLAAETGHGGLQVIAHEVELVGAVLFGRMERRLGRRKRENQPAVARIDVREAEHIAEKRAIRLGVFTV